jgi:hypothetical protein
MPYSTINDIQALNKCHLNGITCTPSYPPMLSSNNGLYSLNANPNRPINCSVPGPVKTIPIRENYQCACGGRRRDSLSYGNQEDE